MDKKEIKKNVQLVCNSNYISIVICPMDNEKTLSPQESLNVILKAISSTKNSIRCNSFYFLLWGWLIAVASFGFFIMKVFFHAWFHFVLFPILAFSGGIITIVHYSRKRVVSTESYVSHFLSRLWAVLGIAFIMTVFINVSHHEPPFTYTLMLAGIGTLVSGWVMKFRPLIFGGALFLVSSLASVYVLPEYQALLQGIAVVAGYLVPGYLLKNTAD
jgi:hypothetical protein